MTKVKIKNTDRFIKVIESFQIEYVDENECTEFDNPVDAVTTCEQLCIAGYELVQ